MATRTRIDRLSISSSSRHGRSWPSRRGGLSTTRRGASWVLPDRHCDRTPAQRYAPTVRRLVSAPANARSRATSWRSVSGGEDRQTTRRWRRSCASLRAIRRSRCSWTVPGPRISRSSPGGSWFAICATNRFRCSRRCGSPAVCGTPPPPWRTSGSCRTWLVALWWGGTSDSIRVRPARPSAQRTMRASRESIQTRVLGRLVSISRVESRPDAEVMNVPRRDRCRRPRRDRRR